MEELIARIVELSANTEQTDMYGLPRFEPYSDPDAVAARFSRPDAQEFYTRFNPQDIVLASFWDDMSLYNFGSLDKMQVGYSIDGKTHESVADWPSDMLVIGSCSEDPIMLDPNNEGEIFFALHGQGEWDPLPIAENIEGLLKLCVAWLEMLQQRGDQVLDDDTLELQGDSWRLFVKLARDQGIPQEYLDNMQELA